MVFHANQSKEINIVTNTFPDSLELYAANHSKIKTCIKLLGLNFGLCRAFKWNFTVVDISAPIIGSDILRHFNLLVEIRNKKLIDGITKISTLGSFDNSQQGAVKDIFENPRYHDL